MVDTVVFQFEKKDIRPILDKLKISEDKYSKNCLEGHLHNFLVKIDITPAGHSVTILGSLNKYYFKGKNIRNINILQVQEAVNRLTKELNIDPNECEVYRVDIGSNLITTYRPEIYTTLLDSIKGFKKTTILDCETVYFQKSRRKKVLAFYNKVKESRKSEGSISGMLVSKNLLRYEIRFKNLEELLEIPKFTLNELKNPRNLKHLIRIWEQEYLAVKKLELPKFRGEPHIKEIKNFLIQFGFHQLGGWLNLERILEPHFKKFPKIRKDRVRKSLRESINFGKYDESELTREVDHKVIFRSDISSFERLL